MRADGTWTVLVVASEARSRTSLARCLDEDYRVLAANSVGDAQTILASEEVDLVLCDQKLPELNAVEFFRATRISHPEPIRMLITGDTDHKNMIRSINEAAVYQVVPKNLRALIKESG